MKTLHVVCRIETLTGKPAIFYRNEAKFGRFKSLSVYTHEEMHSDASYDYYRTRTRPLTSVEERVAGDNLMREYQGIVRIYDDCELVIHNRLRSN